MDLRRYPKMLDDAASVPCLVRLDVGIHSFCKTETTFAASAAGRALASGDADDTPVSDMITGFISLPMMVKEAGA